VVSRVDAVEKRKFLASAGIEPRPSIPQLAHNTLFSGYRYNRYHLDDRGFITSRFVLAVSAVQTTTCRMGAGRLVNIETRDQRPETRYELQSRGTISARRIDFGV
jgi:hypothetical protein